MPYAIRMAPGTHALLGFAAADGRGDRTMRHLLAVICVLILGSAPAAAQEILHCSDKGSIGFQWKDGKITPVQYVPYNFIVKVISPTERIIAGPGQEYIYIRYRCSEMSKPKGVIACARPDAPTTFPVNFKGRNYERVGNMSVHVGGDPDLYVAYGSCIDF